MRGSSTRSKVPNISGLASTIPRFFLDSIMPSMRNLLSASLTTFLLTPKASASSSSLGKASPGWKDFFFKYSLNLTSTRSAIVLDVIGVKSLFKSLIAISYNKPQKWIFFCKHVLQNTKFFKDQMLTYKCYFLKVYDKVVPVSI